MRAVLWTGASVRTVRVDPWVTLTVRASSENANVVDGCCTRCGATTSTTPEMTRADGERALGDFAHRHERCTQRSEALARNAELRARVARWKREREESSR